MTAFSKFLAADLGVRIVEWGDTFAGVFEANAETFQPIDPARIAATLVHGSQRDDAVGIACLRDLVSAAMFRDEDYLTGVDELYARIGRHVDLEDAARWIRIMLAQRGESEYETLTQLAELNELPDDARRELSLAVLPLIVELDGPHGSEVAGVLRAIAERHREVAPDLTLAVPRLCEMLADAAHVSAAAYTLAMIADPRAIEPLIAALPASGTINALGALEAKAAVHALSRVLLETTNRHERDSIIHALVKIDRVGGAPAIARVADPHVMNATVIDACEAGAASGDAASKDFLERAARSREPRMRSRALRALARIDGHSRLEELIAAVDEDDAEVRAFAIDGLRSLRDPRALDALVRGLRHRHAGAAIALGELRDPRAVGPLVEVLAIDDPYYQTEVSMKESVIAAIGDIGVDDSGAWAGLTRRLRHRSDHVAEYAAVACQQLRPGCRAGHALIVRKLGQMMNNEHYRRRELPPLLVRLDAVARARARPHGRTGATKILGALEALERDLPSPELAATIATWRAWLA